MARIVGIDPGAARIGIAISDESRAIAFPREAVSAKGGRTEAAARVRRALEGEPLALVVVGLPLRLDGTEGEAARRARALGEAIGAELGVPVQHWDERLTTVAADRALTEMGQRGRKRREVVDESAATILLQSFLDATTDEPWKGRENR